MASTEASRRGMSKLHLDIASEAYSDCLASIASSSELSIVDPAVSKNTTSKKEKPTGGVKLKKSIAKKTKPKEAESNGESPSGDTFISRGVLLSECTRYQDRRKYSKSLSRFSCHQWHRTEGWR